jgi:branched-chain amino acid transport system permease protein
MSQGIIGPENLGTRSVKDNNMEYFIGLVVFVCIWAILGISLALIMGYSGIFSFGHAAFWGIGAYCSAILSVKLGWNFFPAMLVGIVIGAILSLIISIPSIRIHEDYFVILSLAFLNIFHYFVNDVQLTGGPVGIRNIPTINIFGISLSSNFKYAIYAVVMLIIVFLIAQKIVGSAFGTTLKGISEDEVAVKSLGKNVAMHKIAIIAISGSLAAIAGSLYAHFSTYVGPNEFFADQTVMMACIVILGGLRNLKGIILGAAIIVLVPELMRFTGLPPEFLGEVRNLLYGLMLVLLMIFRPEGLLSRKRASLNVGQAPKSDRIVST